MSRAHDAPSLPDHAAVDLARCQFGVRGLSEGRCTNAPKGVMHGASICNDCILDLIKRGAGGEMLLLPLENIHG